MAVVALNRLGFGPRPGDIEAFNALGDNDTDRLHAWVDQQLDPENIDNTQLDRQVAFTGYESIGLSRRQSWVNYVRNEDGEYNAATPLVETRLHTLQRAVHSNAQLVEMLADFWHSHFNVYGEASIVRSMMVSYDRDVIRAHMLGNFREFLGAVAQSTAMLFYLDNVQSTDAGPNENWARELLELHTLGEEHYLGAGVLQSDVETDADGRPVGYVDDDVYEATRAFTGWTVAAGRNDGADTGEFLYVRDNHDRFQKQVLGRFLQADQADLADGNDVLDVLAEHPGTAKHVCQKLCQRLIADNPPQSLVESAAAVFMDNTAEPDQLKLVVEHIVKSADLVASFGQKVRRPFDFLAAFLRHTDTQLNYGDGTAQNLLRAYNRMGQQLFAWPAPDGYSDQSQDWLNTNSIFTRWWFANEMLSAREDDNWIVDLDMPREITSANGIVDFWLMRVLGFMPAESTRQPIVDFMAQGFDADFDLGRNDETEQRTRAVVALIHMSPEYVWR